MPFFSIISIGTSASGVPGDVNGYYTVWKKYGRLSWRELVQPAIDMAKNGFPFGKSAHEAGLRSLRHIKKDPGLRYNDGYCSSGYMSMHGMC